MACSSSDLGNAPAHRSGAHYANSQSILHSTGKGKTNADESHTIQIRFSSKALASLRQICCTNDQMFDLQRAHLRPGIETLLRRLLF